MKKKLLDKSWNSVCHFRTNPEGSGPPGKSQVAIGFLLDTGMDPLEKPLFLKGGLYGLR